MYSDGSYEEVLSQLTDGLAWASGWEDRYASPSKSAIFQARARLGAEPLQELFDRVARPIGTTATAGGWLAGRRLVAVDGTCLDVADTAENEAFFGRPGVNKGERAAFPQARVVALAECGTHAMFAAVVGGSGDRRADHDRAAAAPSGARDAAAGRSGCLLLFVVAQGDRDGRGPVVADPHRPGGSPA